MTNPHPSGEAPKQRYVFWNYHKNSAKYLIFGQWVGNFFNDYTIS